MGDNLDSGNSRDGDTRQADVVLAWLVKHFPQVAVSMGLQNSGFLPVTDAWRRDGDFVDNLLNYQNRFATGMDDRTRGAHLISFYSHHLSIVAGAVYLLTGLVPDLHPDRLMIRF
ncbi:hypothetical protein LP421_28615 [Rhizobium sp. RCAM05350]|nr:hypothetical protein LP421_28615 [Rhizobium sp. RCAM05350]